MENIKRHLQHSGSGEERLKVPVQETEALLVGIVVGLIFARLRLPIPAPPTVAGLLGIVGIYLGYKLAGLF